MNIENKLIWQVAAGDDDRNYADYFLEWDIVASGPGKRGPWPECYAALRADGWTERKMSITDRLCKKIQSGDIIVLRLGTNKVYGVGEAVGDYLWLDDFGDIDGWDLQHTRRVRWLWRYKTDPQTFPVYTMKLGDTIQPLDSPKVKEWIRSLDISRHQFRRNLCPLPHSCEDRVVLPDVDVNDISDYLFDQEIAATSIDALLAQIDELIRIANWYQRTKQATSEHETIAYLVVPLLRALGWTPQKMAVEWNKVDIALFNQMPRQDSNLVVTLEAKKRGNSCLTARSQAERYAEKYGKRQCLLLIVTDGIRYGIYVRAFGEQFTERPIAYLNLTRMKKSYPILKCQGAKEALLVMAADWNGSPPTMPNTVSKIENRKSEQSSPPPLFLGEGSGVGA